MNNDKILDIKLAIDMKFNRIIKNIMLQKVYVLLAYYLE